MTTRLCITSIPVSDSCRKARGMALVEETLYINAVKVDNSGLLTTRGTGNMGYARA
jgi:hypothetical protein